MTYRRIAVLVLAVVMAMTGLVTTTGEASAQGDDELIEVTATLRAGDLPLAGIFVDSGIYDVDVLTDDNGQFTFLAPAGEAIIDAFLFATLPDPSYEVIPGFETPLSASEITVANEVEFALPAIEYINIRVNDAGQPGHIPGLGESQITILDGLDDLPPLDTGVWFVQVDTVDGAATVPVFAGQAFSIGASALDDSEIRGEADYEGADPTHVMFDGPDPLEVRYDTVRADESCPADFESHTAGPGEPLSVFDGEPVIDCVAVRNISDAPLTNMLVERAAWPESVAVDALDAGADYLVAVDRFIDADEFFSRVSVSADDVNDKRVSVSDEAPVVIDDSAYVVSGRFTVGDVPVVGATARSDESSDEWFTDDNGEFSVVIPEHEVLTRVILQSPASDDLPELEVGIFLENTDGIQLPIALPELVDIDVQIVNSRCELPDADPACGYKVRIQSEGGGPLAGTRFWSFQVNDQRDDVVSSATFRTVSGDDILVSAAGPGIATTDDFEFGWFAELTADDLGEPVLIPLARGTCMGRPVTIDMRTGASGIGTSGDDVIMGTNKGDVIDGRHGNDVICGGGGNDRITGGDGKDIVRGGDGKDRIYGGPGDDELHGGLGDDRIEGEDGDDVLRGNDGADLLDGGDGADDLAGGNGDDLLRAGPGIDLLRGGRGNDVLNGDGDDDELVGGPDDDFLRGGAGVDLLRGNDGIDILKGGFDDDVLRGGAGAGTLHGGGGHDKLYGGPDDDTMFGSVGNDFMRGADGFDYLDGGSGDDELFGNDDDDTLLGGKGLDELNGGNGTDWCSAGVIHKLCEQGSEPQDLP